MHVAVLNLDININFIKQDEWETFCGLLSRNIKLPVDSAIVSVARDGQSAEILFYLEEREGLKTVQFNFNLYECTKVVSKNDKQEGFGNAKFYNALWIEFLLSTLKQPYEAGLIRYAKEHKMDITSFLNDKPFKPSL